MKCLIVDRIENSIEQARLDHWSNQISELAGIPIFHDPEQNGLFQVLLGLPALERFEKILIETVQQKEVDAVSCEFPTAGLQQTEGNFFPVRWMSLLDEL